MSDWSAEVLVDASLLAGYAAVLPPKSVETLIRSFASELRTRPATLRALLDDRDIAGLRRGAHLMRGAALNMGAMRVAALCAAIEQAAEENIASLVGRMPGCADATLARLHAQALALALPVFANDPRAAEQAESIPRPGSLPPQSTEGAMRP